MSSITEEETKDILFDLIRPAVVMFKSCKQNLRDRDDQERVFNFELTDEEIEILINFMVIEFIDSNYVRVPTLMKASLVSKDFYALNQKDHLNALMNMQSIFNKRNRQLISAYSYTNSSLFDILNQE